MSKSVYRKGYGYRDLYLEKIVPCRGRNSLKVYMSLGLDMYTLLARIHYFWFFLGETWVCVMYKVYIYYIYSLVLFKLSIFNCHSKVKMTVLGKNRNVSKFISNLIL